MAGKATSLIIGGENDNFGGGWFLKSNNILLDNCMIMRLNADKQCYILGSLNILYKDENNNVHTELISFDTRHILGCTYNLALNYNSMATVDDGSCNFDIASKCVGDVNNDGIVNVEDLNIVLQNLFTTCN